jgi:hypothetical protein
MSCVGAKSGSDGERQGPSCRSSTLPVSLAWRPDLIGRAVPGPQYARRTRSRTPGARSTTPRRCMVVDQSLREATIRQPFVIDVGRSRTVLDLSFITGYE